MGYVILFGISIIVALLSISVYLFIHWIIQSNENDNLFDE